MVCRLTALSGCGSVSLLNGSSMEAALWMALALLGLGALAGLIGGMVGISGGMMTIPGLLALFHYQGKIPPEHVMHFAIGTSLAAMVLNGISATWVQSKRRAVRWEVVLKMSWGALGGALIGSWLAEHSSSTLLEKIFAIAAAIIGLYFLFIKIRRRADGTDGERVPRTGKLMLLGSFTGFLAGVLGIGGGIITVPILLHLRMKEHQAVATSIALGLFTSFLVAVLFSWWGAEEVDLANSIGYVYLPAFLLLGIASFLVAPIGVDLSHKLSTVWLRKLFGAALMGVALAMWFG